MKDIKRRGRHDFSPDSYSFSVIYIVEGLGLLNQSHPFETIFKNVIL